MNALVEFLEQVQTLLVWDRGGRVYVPVFGYGGDVVAYARRDEAWANHQQYIEEHLS